MQVIQNGKEKKKSKQRKMDIYPQKRVLDALLQGTDWNKIPSYSQSKGITDYRSHGDGHSPTPPLYNSNRFQMRINTLKPNRQPGAWAVL